MNIFEQADLARSKFTETDEAIYNSLIKLPDVFAKNSITKASESCGCSAAALTRFTKKIGFNGFKEFQYKLIKDLKNDNDLKYATEKDQYSYLTSSILEIAKKSEFKQLRDQILNTKYVYTLGFNLARLAAEFLSIGLNVDLGDKLLAQCLPYDLISKKYSSKDTLIIFSTYTGGMYQTLLKNISSYPAEDQPYMCLITMNSKHKLRKYCNNTIVLPSIKQATANHEVTLELAAFNMFTDMLITKIHG
ncbi:MurR/RpiR family transcriptional regulator [Lactobacillus amylovorus]|uniref:MurR/RpiR family transcriptional regulator n=1 Tax=Lactobacillus amylovorus TaxID=1604 RepID=UPI0030A2F6C6